MDGEGGDGSNSQEHNYSNQDPYSPSSGFDDNSINKDEKFKDDSIEPENNKKYDETDLNQIILDEDESHPDGAVPRFVIQGLGDPPEKPPLNGDVSLSGMSLKDGNDTGQNLDQDENNGCGSLDCMYYTLMCCECSVL
ncbi:uncharacterized protein LOC106673828 [Cimex lectularius]|uniref:Uncharacterized protein n=1 Tax=Cimex lectularius TaxID=79782 RepID=A0A8I6SDJ0_CIMLE|nr:uncharacterized protein LOC106673828 [Cimex lectularius]XP_014261624.1 uncharacterized protein LOC106673828 [Cimex lectularius]XP_014261625.1 uncharacterized protein LOC106673828 [Cimex lectularius]XP_014261626.1 uncharacterized protein LOC106673828 [Cimex lectularius]XP_014261627.1 uncharacterized protein LOC106673828 [Cimex lectularius]